MDDTTFLSRFAQWQSTLQETDLSKHEAWKYGTLCALYLEATAGQRRQLPHLVALEDTEAYENRLWNLIGYMRLVSEQITTSNDVYPLHLGLAAAAILEERLDFRDIIVSLAFLYQAAKRAGIDPAPHFKEVGDLARPETADFIRGFLRRSKREIKRMAEHFAS
jgi:hypothetical protein